MFLELWKAYLCQMLWELQVLNRSYIVFIPDDQLSIPGFMAPERKDRTLPDLGRIFHGGVACYVRNGLAYNRRPDLEHPTMEMMWMEFTLRSGKFLLAVVYRPPSEPIDFWTTFEENIQNVRDSTDLPIYLCGDLNNDILNPKNTITPLLNRQGITIMNSQATHHAARPTCLDLFATSTPDKVNAGPTLSNHSAVILHKDGHHRQPQGYTRTVSDYSRADWDKINHNITLHPWPPLEADCDLDQAARIWTEEFTAIVNSHTPTKKITIRDGDKKWMNYKIRRLMQLRDRIYRRAKHRPKSDPLWLKHRRICKRKNEEIKKAKEKRINDLAEKINKGPHSRKEWWKTASGLYKKKKDTTSCPLLHEDSVIHDNNMKANIFNEYFSKMSELQGNDDDIPECDIPRCEAEINNIVTTETEVKKRLNALKVGSATGYDGVSNLALKKTCEAITPYLTYLFNRCLEEGKMPNCWKRANVTPILKKGSANNTKNYRPISLLRCTSKVLEKIVHHRVMKHVSDNNLIPPNQYGFVKGSSTTSQLLDISHLIATALDSRLTLKLLFLDVSKAFDRVWHKALLFKLERLGIRGTLLKWFADYLTQRYQRVVLRGIYSRWIQILAGVPQGSLLGPWLYIMFTSDIIYQIVNIIKLYADDSLLMTSGEDEHECSLKLEQDIQKISSWARRWKILLNPLKTVCLTVTRTHRQMFPLFMDGVYITEVYEHKHLGMFLQRNGRWGHNIDHMVGRASKRLFVLRNYTKNFSRQTLKQLYISYIRPILEYGNQVWSNITLAEEEQLEEIQRDAIRIIAGLKIGTSHDMLYREVDLPLLKERRRVARTLSMYDITKSETPGRLNKFTIETVNDRNPCNTRQGNNLTLPLPRTEQYRRSFLPTAIREWNALPQPYRGSVSRNSLKNKIKHKKNQNPYYNHVLTRMSSVNLARLRVGNHNLNGCLFERLMCESPRCECGHSPEDPHHYLLMCHRYDRLRSDVVKSIPFEAWNLPTLLHGSNRYNQSLNQKISLTVQKFITTSARF